MIRNKGAGISLILIVPGNACVQNYDWPHTAAATAAASRRMKEQSNYNTLLEAQKRHVWESFASQSTNSIVSQNNAPSPPPSDTFR